MTLKLVKPDSKQGGEVPPPPVQPEPTAALPWLTRRLAMAALLIVLVLMGAVTLAFGWHLSKMADAFQLTLQFGARTTYVHGVNVKLTEGTHEATCVLSLLEVRELREHAMFLLEVEPLQRPPRGAPTFEMSISDPEHGGSNAGALPKDQLDPLDAWIIRHASACIRKYEMQLPTPVR